MLYNSKYNNYSDAELINNFLENQDTVFIGVLYSRYGHLVLGLCYKYFKNKDESEDMTMHIFECLMTDLKKHRIDYFKSWLYTYSKNHCLMKLRKDQSLQKKQNDLYHSQQQVMETDEDLHLHEEKEKMLSILDQAIAYLNEEQRVCVNLFYKENKSYAEIQVLTGYSANEVKSFIQNGKRNLKLKMEALQNEQRAQ
ncbi:MAG: sigma-70 family RNA polymerase sigma factor [Sediminibacterium sp.]|nr:sigma-70 family RNA polymerase sigma factor [Sediminibacterium sp.]